LRSQRNFRFLSLLIAGLFFTRFFFARFLFTWLLARLVSFFLLRFPFGRTPVPCLLFAFHGLLRLAHRLTCGFTVSFAPPLFFTVQRLVNKLLADGQFFEPPSHFFGLFLVGLRPPQLLLLDAVESP